MTHRVTANPQLIAFLQHIIIYRTTVALYIVTGLPSLSANL